MAPRTTSPSGASRISGPALVVPRDRTTARSRAFTLVELVLVLALLGLLSTLAVVGLSGMQSKGRLNEGIDRYQTAVALLRAEAANTGRRMRLAFVAGDDQRFSTLVEWENDPLGAPGAFVAYEGASVAEYLGDDLVRVAACRLTGSSAYQTLAGPGMEGEEELPVPLVFYPDGSCDSAEIHLVSADPADARVAVLKISGSTGHSECTVYSAEDYQEQQQ